MTRSFASIKPPERQRLRAKAQDCIVTGWKDKEDGTKDPILEVVAEIDMEFMEMDIPTGQRASQFAIDMIKKYVPLAERKIVEPSRNDPEAEEFPQGPYTGEITFTEQTMFELSNMLHMQSDPDPLPFQEFVYMRQTAKNCYQECQRVILALNKGEDLEGNLLAGRGLGSSAPQSAKTLAVTPTSSTETTPSSAASTGD